MVDNEKKNTKTKRQRASARAPLNEAHEKMFSGGPASSRVPSGGYNRRPSDAATCLLRTYSSSIEAQALTALKNLSKHGLNQRLRLRNPLGLSHLLQSLRLYFTIPPRNLANLFNKIVNRIDRPVPVNPRDCRSASGQPVDGYHTRALFLRLTAVTRNITRQQQVMCTC